MKQKNSKLQVSSFQFLQIEYENSFKIKTSWFLHTFDETKKFQTPNELISVSSSRIRKSFKITVNAGFEWRVRAPHAPSLGRHRSSHEKRSRCRRRCTSKRWWEEERERERGKIKEKEGKGRSTRIAFTRHEKQPEGEAKVAGNWNSNRGNPTDASPIPGVKLSL